MEFEELTKVLQEIKPIIENNTGLTIFARERSKFEGWLKVELCGILSKHFEDVTPEKDRTDICFGEWGIELKTINTNIRYDGVQKKNRPITKNTQGVINDIDKLSRSTISKKAVMFVTFPAEHDNKNWQVQLNRIKEKLSRLMACDFVFNEGIIKGVIYFGLI
ncbi:hypothetical protein ACFLU0_01310 [Chloroflexota bacterium]